MIFYSFLDTLKSVVKLRFLTIDSAVSRLHYRLTSALLFISSLLLTATQFFGDPIDCEQNSNINQAVLETYCWTHSTYSVVAGFHKKVGVEVPYPGVINGHQQDKVYHAYYQWVGFFLLIQAILFYLPRYFWKMSEGGKVRNLIQGLDSPIIDAKEKAVKRTVVVEYLTSHAQMHRIYAIKYFISEVLYFVNIIGQIFMVDAFLGGEFSQFGVNVIYYNLYEDNETRTDPMMLVFPRRTKCDYHRFGSSGSIETIDSFCILPLNIINEKIFIAMWFWFIILAIITAITVALTATVIFNYSARAYLIKSRCPLVKKELIEEVSRSLTLGDWLLVYLLSKNLEPRNMGELLVDICDKVRGHHFHKHSIGSTMDEVNVKQGLELSGYSKDNLIGEYHPYNDGTTRV